MVESISMRKQNIAGKKTQPATEKQRAKMKSYMNKMMIFMKLLLSK